MVKLYDGGVFLVNGSRIVPETEAAVQGIEAKPDEAKMGTMAYSVLKAHNQGADMDHLKLRFDAMASHDITFVGIIQTARASGMERFPIPYVLTNCHNTLCAVGGTINEDDHLFGLSACQKYGGIFVPPHMAVIHQYMRERMAGCGKMILGSDSHTRIALAVIGAVFKNGYVKNKVMEFVGPGIASMTTDFRNGVDVMTTETTCLSSIWCTDEDTKAYLTAHGRGEDYKKLAPAEVAYYDGCVYVDLSSIKPMIALPFHPSNAFEIESMTGSFLEDVLRETEKEAERISGRPYHLTDKVKDGRLHVQQGVIAGCAGGSYTNLMEAARILKDASCGNDIFSLSVYPASQPVFMDLVKKGAVNTLMGAGAIVRTAFCGPCFGAGDTPANDCLSIRHTTRNFPNREGSKPGNGQMAAVALMDARSIAATARNGGVLTSAEAFCDGSPIAEYEYDNTSYEKRVYQGFGKADETKELIYGPNIKDWPEMEALSDQILLKVVSKIMDPVTTTDELIPSGETSSYRSNPLGLAEFTLSRRDPGYVGRAKETDRLERMRLAGDNAAAEDDGLAAAYEAIRHIDGCQTLEPEKIQIGSAIYAVKPGDGSAREQAASCQRVLGGLANLVSEYATKRYRSNVINWGMLPFQMEGEPPFSVGDYVFVPHVKAALDGDMKHINAYVISGKTVSPLNLFIADMTAEEKEIVKAGCLINYNRR